MYKGQAVSRMLDDDGKDEDQISGVINWTVEILDKDCPFQATAGHFLLTMTEKWTIVCDIRFSAGWQQSRM